MDRCELLGAPDLQQDESESSPRRTNGGSLPYDHWIEDRKIPRNRDLVRCVLRQSLPRLRTGSRFSLVQSMGINKISLMMADRSFEGAARMVDREAEVEPQRRPQNR